MKSGVFKFWKIRGCRVVSCVGDCFSEGREESCNAAE